MDGGKKETITKGERSAHEEKNEKWEETGRGFICDISTSSASCLNCAGLSKVIIYAAQKDMGYVCHQAFYVLCSMIDFMIVIIIQQKKERFIRQH